MLKDRQDKNNLSVMMTSISVVILALLCFNACTTIHLNTIPSPVPSAKLRVFIIPITGDPPRGTSWSAHWGTPHEKFKKDTFSATGRFLQRTGIYEVVPEEDIRAVLGTQDFAGWQWLRNDLALVKQVGRALHADYAIITERNFIAGLNFQFKMVCVNLESGRQYTTSGFASLSAPDAQSATRKLVQTSYQRIFYDAKGDMLATAIRKGRLVQPEVMKKSPLPDTKLALAPQPSTTHVSIPPQIPQALPISKPPATEEKPALIQKPLEPKTPAEVSIPQTVIAKPPESTVKQMLPDIKKDTDTPKIIAKIPPAPPPDLPVVDKRKNFENKLEKELQDETLILGKNRLVVYDFDTIEHLNVVALILTEALREELFILGRFRLVNRENMIQVLQELKLQQSGIADETQVVQLGKWLAANEAVTGRLAVLGNTYILQAKRTDIKTLGTLGLGSLKCTVGHEEELLSGMSGLARKLIQSKM
jgi:hypothetical protein